MNWITRLIERPKQILGAGNSGTPEGLWVKCSGCGEALYNKELERSLMVCPKCSHHLRVDATQRAQFLFDPDSFELHDQSLHSEDPLNFRDKKRYRDRLKEAARRADNQDSVRNYLGDIGGHTVSASIFEFGFMGGSMGSVSGEKIVRAMERSLDRHCPYLLVAASGGARMQEGVLSLMQMAKTSAAAGRLQDAKLPFICLLTDPTMGGVSASVAWLGDIVLAEPGALIGFAGPRVIQETVGESLPEGFQRSEFLLEHGLIDAVVDRREMRACLRNLLGQMTHRPYRQAE
ncbi:MAG TPA: acetyl-CoA carboxylase, carboxyltransferase subunit beta [Mariprofundaceae bacterium]|nr:acetyl-CoA carboxylase, carboxyltransferase subunit beta [Mariprofundaceae bacterium]